MGRNQIDFALEKPHDKTRGGIRMSFIVVIQSGSSISLSVITLPINHP